jgi:hypothetical protein
VRVIAIRGEINRPRGTRTVHGKNEAGIHLTRADDRTASRILPILRRGDRRIKTRARRLQLREQCRLARRVGEITFLRAANTRRAIDSRACKAHTGLPDNYARRAGNRPTVNSPHDRFVHHGLPFSGIAHTIAGEVIAPFGAMRCLWTRSAKSSRYCGWLTSLV